MGVHKGYGYEFTPAGIGTLQVFRQKWLLKASYTSNSYSSFTKLPLPGPFFFLLFLSSSTKAFDVN